MGSNSEWFYAPGNKQVFINNGPLTRNDWEDGENSTKSKVKPDVNIYLCI